MSENMRDRQLTEKQCAVLGTYVRQTNGAADLSATAPRNYKRIVKRLEARGFLKLASLNSQGERCYEITDAGRHRLANNEPAKRKIPAVDKCDICGCEYVPTGKIGRCLPCRRKAYREWREKRKAEGRPISEDRATYEAHYYRDPENRKKRNERSKKYYWDPNSRPKTVARDATREAIRRGELIRGPCEVCGESKTDAHHDDYSRPLDVRWLCRAHHAEHHQNLRNVEGR